MRQSTLLIPTLKENPADAQVVSHRLMLRAGYIRQVAAGIYTYLPLAWRVLNKVSNIVREELNNAGAQEIMMPMIQPAELWEQSGRWQAYGPELLRMNDRKGTEFCAGPTHEEVVTSLVASEVQSYKQLPLNLYQIQTKFRDEVRPRFGLMRGREFIMKDAYSFDIDEAAANISYDKMFAAYKRIFERCGLAFRPVEADTGSIGGNRSHEFQVLAETGEDSIVSCTNCGYAANVELAEIHMPDASQEAAVMGSRAFETADTPGKQSCEEVADFLALPIEQTIKSLLFVGRQSEDEELVIMALCRGDDSVNEIKLKKALNLESIELAPDELAKSLGLPPGYMGPVMAPSSVKVIADARLIGCREMVCGANEEQKHHIFVGVGEHFATTFADLREATAGDACGRCGSSFELVRGIEVGHVFFLGDKYSKAMNATVLDENGKAVPTIMGCYGIGIGRTAAAAIEQNHDEGGIIWPEAIAPFDVHVLSLGKDDEVFAASEKLVKELEATGFDVLWDDRKERPGVKFKDADLIGIPWRVSVGARGLKEGVVEVKRRTDSKDDAKNVKPEEVITLING